MSETGSNLLLAAAALIRTAYRSTVEFLLGAARIAKSLALATLKGRPARFITRQVRRVTAQKLAIKSFSTALACLLSLSVLHYVREDAERCRLTAGRPCSPLAVAGTPNTTSTCESQELAGPVHGSCIAAAVGSDSPRGWFATPPFAAIGRYALYPLLLPLVEERSTGLALAHGGLQATLSLLFLTCIVVGATAIVINAKQAKDLWTGLGEKLTQLGQPTRQAAGPLLLALASAGGVYWYMRPPDLSALHEEAGALEDQLARAQEAAADLNAQLGQERAALLDRFGSLELAIKEITQAMDHAPGQAEVSALRESIDALQAVSLQLIARLGNGNVPPGDSGSQGGAQRQGPDLLIMSMSREQVEAMQTISTSLTEVQSKIATIAASQPTPESQRDLLDRLDAIRRAITALGGQAVGSGPSRSN